ncbi:MAG TPA: NAD(P)-dependent oxidoreductase, partial [Chthoniobacterales bacterium]
IIGSRVAVNYRDAGHPVWLWNRSPKPLPGFLGSPQEVARRAARIFIYVADGPASLAVIDQMAPALTPGHVIVNHATIGPDEARECARRAAAAGARYLDAPFTGSRDAAAQRQIVYYLGGDEAVQRAVEPILRLNAKAILPVGGVGDASLMKLATNLVSASIVSALAEAVAVVRAAGGDPEKFALALENNASRSATTDLKLPAMLRQDFAPRFSLKHMLKDTRLVRGLAASHGLPLPSTEAFIAKAAALAERGFGDEDFSVLGKTE